MNRFYLEEDLQLSEMKAELHDKEELKHLTKVLRLGVDDQVEVCDSKGREFLARISKIQNDCVAFDLIKPLTSRELPIVIDLFQGVPKGQKWDYLLQKSVECGVTSITPVQMKRSIAKITEESSSKKGQRWQKIADEAAKQSKRSIKPPVHEAVSFSGALKKMENYDLVLVAYENEEQASIKTYEALVKEASRIAIWVGPEGGIDQEEIEQLKEKAKCISLGKRILRTESASMVMLAQLSYILE